MKRSRWAPWFTALGSLLFLALLFTVPYHVPSVPVVSDSYVFGYNNRAGQCIVAVWLILLALFGPPLRVADAKGRPLRRSTLLKALAITGAIALVLYLATRQLNGFAESVYFNDRLLLVLEGHTPYKDFEYAYGAGLLYVPAVLVWLLHLPPNDAYGLFWVAGWIVGVWLLYLTIKSVEELPGSQRPVFLLLWACSLTQMCCVGVNYSLLRFILPCWLATVIHRKVVAPQPGNGRSLALLLPLPSYIVLLLVSPELALAFAIGISVYLLRFGRLRERRNALAFVTAVLGIAGVSWLALRLGVFSTLAAFRAGGYNFPLMPAPHLLLLFVLLAACALYAGQELRRSRPGVLLALIAGSAVSLASALGRADQVHALMNPLGITLAGFLLLCGYPWLGRGVFVVGWLLMFLLLLPMMFRDTPLALAKAEMPAIFAHEFARNGSAQMTNLDRSILERMTRALGPEAANEKFQERRFYAHTVLEQNNAPMDVPAIFGLPPGTVFYAPLEFFPDRSGIYQSRFVQEGYFLGVINVTTPAEILRKTSEVTAHTDRPLLLPPDFEQICGPRAPVSTGLLRSIFRYPYHAPAVHTENLLAPFCEAIHANFHQVGPSIPEHFGYLLWVPNAR